MAALPRYRLPLVACLLLSLAQLLLAQTSTERSKPQDNERQIKAVLKKARESYHMHDFATYAQLLADSFTAIHVDGTVTPRSRWLEVLKTNFTSPQGIQETITPPAENEIDIHLYNGNTSALAFYPFQEHDNYYGKKIDVSFSRQATLIKQNGEWKIASFVTVPSGSQAGAPIVAHAVTEYPGRYQLGPNLQLKLKPENGILLIQVSNDPKWYSMVELEEDIYTARDLETPGYLVFLRDHTGKVNRVGFHFEGKYVIYPKSQSAGP